MESLHAQGPEIAGVLETGNGPVPVQVLRPGSHTMFVRFFQELPPPDRTEFRSLRLTLENREVVLGPCRYHSHAQNPTRRQSDSAPVGDGRLVFTQELYDFSSLARSGVVLEFNKRLEQLPVLWGRKKEIRNSFREYVAELVYDVQVYRGVFDEIDRNISHEPYLIRSEIQRAVTQAQYPAFKEFFDQKLSELESQVRGFSAEEHERHGFYLRKHVWDILSSSEFLLRTNLKPRGYAGDSAMMRMVYEDDFRGYTIFSRFMHRHPIQTPAAQAVRNRVELLSGRISRLLEQHQGSTPLRVMSVACGPAWELTQVLRRQEDLQKVQFTLLDQDPDALREAYEVVAGIERVQQQKCDVSFVQDSVRTMLRSADLPARWGRFDFLYSMGLFDYLTAPVARVVLRRLYDLLKPGGELVIGNFHVENPSRLYMEYWMDWPLLYRSREQLLSLAEGLGAAEADVFFEDTGSQMFLKLRKQD